jgi:luciferase-like monooxygenase
VITIGVAATILPVPVKLHWFLPTYGDSRLIVGGGHGTPAGVAHSDRDASIDYLASIVRAAESFGFTGALIPTGAWCEDAFITAALLARETTSLAFLVAFRPPRIASTAPPQSPHPMSLQHAPTPRSASGLDQLLAAPFPVRTVHCFIEQLQLYLVDNIRYP